MALTNSELMHYGIKGMKWGIRRYQNADGTRTSEGKRREYYRRRVQRELKYVDDVNDIVDSLSSDEKRKLGMKSTDKKWIEDGRREETTSNIAKTFVEYYEDTPVSMIEIWDKGNGTGEIAIATNPKHRGTGATTRNINNAIEWFNSDRNKELRDLQWNNLKENPKSGQIAEKFGFGELETDEDWEYRVRRKGQAR